MPDVSGLFAGGGSDLLAYGALFLLSLGAATILPMPSETALVGMLLAGYPPWPVLAIASAGNTLGAVFNWYIGRLIDRYGSTRWSSKGARTIERARTWYHRYGRWTLLLSWMPVIGDPLTIVAGMLRERFEVVLMFVAVAKFGRYLVVTAVTLWLH